MLSVTARPLLTLLLAVTFFGGFNIAVRQSDAAESPESAVQNRLELRGKRYAGACDQTVSPRDIGMLCSRLGGERAGVSAYLVGRTFSEFDHWLFVSRAGGAWSVAGEAPLASDAESMEIPWP